MKIITSIRDLHHHMGNIRQEQVALVPTMGCLHAGHLSLIQQAKRLADIVVVSIYVNPLQFAANEDLETYPQPFAQDAKLCEQAGVDIIFHPPNLYPEQAMQVHLHVADLSHRLCGATRRDHFDGVVTVVNILFNLIQPNLAIFGEKDFQQLTIIRRMVSDLHMPIEIIEGETVREHDGLAKSSRNRYLNEKQRKQACFIIESLILMQKEAEKQKNTDKIIKKGTAFLKKHDIQPEYVQICDENTLKPLENLQQALPARIFIAAPIGAARLIDNIAILHPQEEDSPCV